MSNAKPTLDRAIAALRATYHELETLACLAEGIEGRNYEKTNAILNFAQSVLLDFDHPSPEETLASALQSAFDYEAKGHLVIPSGLRALFAYALEEAGLPLTTDPDTTAIQPKPTEENSANEC